MRIALLLLAVVGISACVGDERGATADGTTGTGGSAAGTGGLPPTASVPVRPEEFAEVYMDVLCEAGFSCCPEGSALTQEVCDEYGAAMHGRIIEQLDLEAVSWDAEAAGECVAWTKDDLRDCSLLVNDKTCERAMVGSLPEGAACKSNVQCAQGDERIYCNDKGVCAPDPEPIGPGHGPEAGLGEACGWTCESRDDGETPCVEIPGASGDAPVCWRGSNLACDEETGKCVPAAAKGESCTYAIECQEGFYCDTGTCAPLGQLGDPCEQTRGCTWGLICRSGQCSEKAQIGEACESSEDCIDGAECKDYVCVENRGLMDRICEGDFG